MAFDKEAAKAAGYSEQEIAAYLAEKNTEPQGGASSELDDKPPPPDRSGGRALPNEAPDNSLLGQVKQYADEVTGGRTNEILGTLGLGAGAAALPAAGYLAAKGILRPAVQAGSELLNRGVGAAEAANANAAATEARVAANQAARAAAAAPKPLPTATSPILGANGQPLRPVVPEMPANAATAARGAAAAETGGNWMANALNMAKQYGPALAKVGTGLAAATYSPETGPSTPQVGRMRGMEINPLTGRPWTRDQIAQYSANPAIYDQQMAQPQFRR